MADAQPLPPLKPAWRKHAFLAVKLLLAGGVLSFVGRALLQRLGQVEWSTVTISPGWALLSAIGIIAVFVLQMAINRYLLAVMLKRLDWPRMMAVTWVPVLGKYVPGKVTAFAAAVTMLRDAGVPAAVGLSVLLLADGLSVLGGLVVGVPVLATDATDVPGGRWVAGFVILCGVIALQPAVFGRLVDTGLKLTGRPPLPHRPRLHEYVPAMLMVCVQWLLWGGVFWCACRSLGPLPLHALWPMVCAAGLSFSIGYLSFFTMGGLGPRDGLLLALLSPLAGAGNAAIVVVAMRVLQILVELLLSAVGVAMLRRATSHTL